MTLRNFDVFEKFPDGSLAWRTRVPGQFQAERKLQELAEHSENEFLAVDILDGEPWPMAGLKRRKQPRKPRPDNFKTPSNKDYETRSGKSLRNRFYQLPATPSSELAFARRIEYFQ